MNASLHFIPLNKDIQYTSNLTYNILRLSYMTSYELRNNSAMSDEDNYSSSIVSVLILLEAFIISL